VPSASVAPATREPSLGDAQFRSRDPLYYDAPLIILVEATLFKIPICYFEKHSDVFWEKYLLGPRGEEVSDDLTDQQPLRLDGVDAAEFRCLLKVMIQGDSEGDMSWTELTSVLKLSLMWEMKLIHDLALQKIPLRIHNSDKWLAALEISTQLKIRGLREMAIEKLKDGPTSPFKKIELGVKYSIQDWLMQGYTEFVTRQEVMSVEDEERLGWSRTSNLFRVRHRRLEGSPHGVQSDIRTAFASEFAEIAAFNKSPMSYLRPDLRAATDPDVVQRDEAYYCVDIIFLVEDTLFKLPRYLFEESSGVFRDMFLIPTPKNTSHDGDSDEQPLFLEGVRVVDFRRLLKAMKFPAKFQASRHPQSKLNKSQKTYRKRLYEEEAMLWNDWASALELSCMWQMAKVRETAVQEILRLQNCQQPVSADDKKSLLRLSTKLGIREIRDKAIAAISSSLQPVEQIQLGIELQVDSWLLEGYSHLVQARGGITVEHEELLGRKKTAKLFRIRDGYLQKVQGRPYGNVVRAFAVEKIREAFGEELRDAVWGGGGV